MSGGRFLYLATFLLVPALSAVTPLIAIPAITSSAGASGWEAYALGLSIGSAAGVIVELGWPLTGPQGVAAERPGQRWSTLVSSVRTRALAFVVVGPLAVIATLVVTGMRAMTRPGPTSWTKIPGGLQTDYFTPLAHAGPPLEMPPPLIVTARRPRRAHGGRASGRRHGGGSACAPDSAAGRHRRQTAPTPYREPGVGAGTRRLGPPPGAGVRRRSSGVVSSRRSRSHTHARAGGFGLSTVEAMSCGTPVVVTPVGANAEVVAGFGEGFVARSTDPQDIARAIIGVLDDPVALAQKRREARELVHPRFEWDNVADAYVAAYDHLARR